ncbi:MAG: hypothetical protein GY749_17475 [Desulfobacteraceae bacterium]|nr:hypothetical protein [Desulfobacteraceae bacterium]
MNTQSLTLHLPENIYRRLQLMAKTTHQPLEEIAFQSIQGNLPPLSDDIPPEWRGDLAELQYLSDAALWTVARESLPEKQWDRHQKLLEQNQTGTLTETEQDELDNLRTVTDRFVFRRSYTLALLRWRGYTLSPETIIS